MPHSEKKKNPHGYCIAFSECVAIEALVESIFATFDGLSIGGAGSHELQSTEKPSQLTKNLISVFFLRLPRCSRISSTKYSI